ncbi:flavodoxin-dependent (E)-4-hydroxy-3-methylbut-2-enyl-diphosphate synthase [Candidatus Woesearchaeota archaeon]|nr:flavodoxin-dependent (E)-4-hydroxy-3-methylbut-2-enyl-diphosphate synthase [Candidatus Woesearchaeota archaeon]
MKTKKIKVGSMHIGGNAPISVQSMTNTDTKDTGATVRQIRSLEKAGCELVRVSAPDMESAKALKEIKKGINIPLAADVHFDYRIALEAAMHADKLRINPGNIGSREKIKEVAKACKERRIPIRIGVNLGSLEKDIEAKLGLTASAMVESASRHIRILEDNDFFDIIVSLKASDVHKMIEANRIFAKRFSYPLHLGVTEAGSVYTGTIKNAVGIGILLEEGIGNTIRVSLSGDPVEEVKAGWKILEALDLRQGGVKVTACPTCARSNIDVASICEEIERKTANVKKAVKVAVMGCAVNGPGEAKESDIGVVGGKDGALLYIDREKKGKIGKDKVVDRVLKEIMK